jgi:molecular chaperone DnaK
MVAEAEQNRDADLRVRQLIDARNELESLAYQVERRLGELGEAAPPHEKARAEMLVGDARQAIKEEAPLERVRSLTGDLQQVAQALLARGGAPGGPTGGPSGPPPSGRPDAGPAGQRPPGDDDVIDADFTPS